MTRRTRAREVALQLLFEHDFGREFDREQLEEFARQPLEEPDEEYSRDALKDTDLLAFCLGLYDGVLANLEQIDERLSQLATNWRLPRMPFVDRNVLRLGAYELLHTPDTPPRVAIDEAIELARRFGSADSPSFVNGILDRVMND